MAKCQLCFFSLDIHIHYRCLFFRIVVCAILFLRATGVCTYWANENTSSLLLFEYFFQTRVTYTHMQFACDSSCHVSLLETTSWNFRQRIIDDMPFSMCSMHQCKCIMQTDKKYLSNVLCYSMSVHIIFSWFEAMVWERSVIPMYAWVEEDEV